MPSFAYQRDLPIYNSLAHVEKLLQTDPVLIIAGETGSGKTTQLPLACLKVGRRSVCHTQPRRLAVRNVADRVAELLGVVVGEEVGFAMRFEDRSSPRTIIKVVTDGLLLTEIQHDRRLRAYDTVIVDEAHERSLNIDLILGYLKKLLRTRSDLRVIVTSATIDVEAFSNFFDHAPIVQVPGRSYPVDIRYRMSPDSMESAVHECLNEIDAEPRTKIQDILVFLSGEREILSWSKWFRRHYRDRFDVLPLYARLPQNEQRKIFQPSDKQRVLLATNVAETSLTVPNIRYVIDFGEARIGRFSLASRIQRLPIEPISQASANQRTGRCGRLAPGICFRLFDEASFVKRERFTAPEIQRTNLASVLLQMIVFRFGRIEEFPLLDRPSNRAVNAAYRLLEELGALREGRVTTVGKKMVQLPIDARLARIVVEGHRLRALTEILIIVSALAVQDPMLRPLDRQKLADDAHQQFREPNSDFLFYLNVWNWANAARQNASRREFDKALMTRFISSNRYYEWRSLHRQLRLTTERLRMLLNSQKARTQDIHRSILSGSLSFVGMLASESRYVGPKDLSFWLFPGSVLASRKPKWVVSAEVIETSRTYARCVAKITPQWIEQYAGNILQRRIHDAYWDSKHGKGMALVDVSVYGLPIVTDRPESLSNHDRPAARELFLLHALVLGETKLSTTEILKNQEFVASLKEIQQRERRFDVVANNEALASFYAERLPQSVFDSQSFKKWYRSVDQVVRATLVMQSNDVAIAEAIHLREDAFPSQLELNGVTYDLKYVFGPNESDDGVSVLIPVVDLYSISTQPLDWLVPGLLEEKCLELMRKLPKSVRKSLSPIPDRLKELLPRLVDETIYRNGSLRLTLSKLIEELFGVVVDPKLWNLEGVSSHLLMNVKVLDERKQLLDQDRDLDSLFQRMKLLLTDAIDTTSLEQYEQRNLKRYPSTGIPAQKVIQTATGSMTLFPVLNDRITTIDLAMRLEPNDHHFDSNLRGMCRFVVFEEQQSVQYLRTEFDKSVTQLLKPAEVREVSELFDLTLLTAVRHTFFKSGELPATQAEFHHAIAQGRHDFIPGTLKLIELVLESLAAKHRILVAIDSLESLSYEDSKNDMLNYVASLFRAEFPYSLSSAEVEELPRYLDGLHQRINNLPGRVLRDKRGISEIQHWEQRLFELANSTPKNKDLEPLRWMLHEYRIAIFCPNLKTRTKVSASRFERLFEQHEKPS